MQRIKKTSEGTSIGEICGLSHMPPVRKRFGQHFLKDTAVVDRIVRAIDPHPGERIVEIGPGRGALTIPLLRRTGELDVVEVDRDLASGLVEQCGNIGRLNLVRQDALKVDFAAFSASSLKVVGNLPYNISTPLLFHLLGFNAVSHMLFMLQREVVERICAPAGAPEYGRLSVMVQARCRTEKLFDVGPTAFSPRPAVESAVLRLTVMPGATSRISDAELFSELVRAAFSARRKKISNGLKPWFDAGQLEALDISPSARPAELSVEDYIMLSNTLG